MNWQKIHDELFAQMDALYQNGTETVQEEHAQERIIADCAKKHNLVVSPLDKYGAGLLLQHSTYKNGGVMSFIVHPTQLSTRVEFVVFLGNFTKHLYEHIMETNHYKMINGMLYIQE